MIENIEVFINNSIRIRDRIGTIYIDPYPDADEEDIIRLIGRKPEDS